MLLWLSFFFFFHIYCKVSRIKDNNNKKKIIKLKITIEKECTILLSTNCFRYHLIQKDTYIFCQSSKCVKIQQNTEKEREQIINHLVLFAKKLIITGFFVVVAVWCIGI